MAAARLVRAHPRRVVLQIGVASAFPPISRATRLEEQAWPAQQTGIALSRRGESGPLRVETRVKAAGDFSALRGKRMGQAKDCEEI